MEDFLDDFDWEDMAMIGGMAEEFGEEERDRRRWERETYRDPEDEFDSEQNLRRRSEKSRYSRKMPRRKPFEQYAYEVAHGLKHHHDPLFGPAKRRGGVSRRPKNYTDTILYGVLAKNAHLVSENFLKFVCTLFYVYPDQKLEHIVFDPDGNPVFDGHEVFSTFDRGSQTITMNLRRHFANAVRIAEHGYTGFSMHALIWSGMVDTVLHEFKHSLDAREAGYMDHLPREEQELMADQWASEAKTYCACNGHSEMPNISEEPYFGPLLKKYIERAISEGEWEWAKRQKTMLADGTYYQNKEKGIDISTMEEFYIASLQGQKQEGLGRQLNDLLVRQNDLENKAWDKDEMCEQAIEEAISKGYRISIEYAEAEGQTSNYYIFPKQLYKQNMFPWVEAYNEKAGDLCVFRIDLITNIRFHS